MVKHRLGKCLGGKLPGGKMPGGNCLVGNSGGNCPNTYIYILIYGRVRGCVIFVEEPPPYLQQGGHRMTVILYLYLYIEKFEVA